MHFGMTWLQMQRFAIADLGFYQQAPLPKNIAQVAMRIDMERIMVDCRAVASFRLNDLPTVGSWESGCC